MLILLEKFLSVLYFSIIFFMQQFHCLASFNNFVRFCRFFSLLLCFFVYSYSCIRSWRNFLTRRVSVFERRIILSIRQRNRKKGIFSLGEMLRYSIINCKLIVNLAFRQTDRNYTYDKNRIFSLKTVVEKFGVFQQSRIAAIKFPVKGNDPVDSTKI